MLERIEKYLNNEMSLTERQDFENQILTNKELANELAFYLQTKAANQEVAWEKRKAEFEELRTEISNRSSERTKPLSWILGLAASVIFTLGFWWFSHTNAPNLEIFADTYIKEHFEILPVKMDGNSDSLQIGLRLFNEQKLSEAQLIFKDILRKENSDSEAVKYAGITALRLRKYDEAIQYFKILALQKDLFANPGKFYQVITLLQQSPLNKKEAEILLKGVIDDGLEGKEEASKMLK